jgi:myo-inositol-1(or 4)-monophosphatase
MAIDFQAVHDTLVAVAFEAGRMIMAANPNAISTDTKMNGTPLPLPHVLSSC